MWRLERLAVDSRTAPVSLVSLRTLPARCTAPTAYRVARNGRLVPTAAATSSQGGDHASAASVAQRAAEDRAAWEEGAFPSYLQSEVDDFCASWSDALQKQDSSGRPVSLVTNDNPVWQAIRREARIEAAEEPLLSSFYHASILSHDSFARSLAFVLANRLADATLLASELFEIFHSVLREDEFIKQAALLDIVAFYERDPACITYSAALLYFKGYHAIQTHRIANVLWHSNRKVMAMALQARVNEVLAIDLHPGATLGKGLLLDHGTGVVIGETSRVGDNVSIMQNVTLGGTGKHAGDRHPKVEANVLIGAGATVLGNITVGKGAQVAAGSLVLKDVPPKTMVAGSPARSLGKVTGNAALRMQHIIRQPDALPPPAGGLGSATPLPQQHQQPHHVPDRSNGSHAAAAPATHSPAAGSSNGAVTGATTSASGSTPSGGAAADGGQPQAFDDPDCLDGSSETRDTADLANWTLSVASKPRRGAGGGGAPGSAAAHRGHSGHIGPSSRGGFAAALSPQVPHSASHGWSASGGGGGGGGGSHVGSRGGVVASLATVQAPDAEVAEATVSRASLLLAPDDCEPYWQLSAGGVPSLAEWALQPAAWKRIGGAAVGTAGDQDGGGQDEETRFEARSAPLPASDGRRGGSSVHSDAAMVAALRRHNNRLLAEAGVLNNITPWTVSAPAPIDAAASPAAQAAGVSPAAEPALPAASWSAATAVASRAEDEGVREEELADYII